MSDFTSAVNGGGSSRRWKVGSSVGKWRHVDLEVNHGWVDIGR